MSVVTKLKCPPQSPELIQIELLWDEHNRYVQPTNLQQLCDCYHVNMDQRF